MGSAAEDYELLRKSRKQLITEREKTVRYTLLAICPKCRYAWTLISDNTNAIVVKCSKCGAETRAEK